MREDFSGDEMYEFLRELLPICRSITGNGVRQTFEIIKRHLPNLEIHEEASGTQCFDWVVPQEWNIRDAYVIDPEGKKIIDFHENNLHVLNYSIPFNGVVSLEELQEHLYSFTEMPDVIPYVTSYYDERWGFCLADINRKRMKPGNYQVVIDSTLEPGGLTYADLVIRGESSQEVLISTYTCHPSMANNETSGIVIATFIAKYLLSQQNLRYTYRIVFAPETIGAIVYLSHHLQHLKEHVVAGFNLTCVGDDRDYSFMPSREGGTLADRAALHVLSNVFPLFKKYNFLKRGSDECQYCSPGVELPFVSIMRTKYGCYPEYHTSKDNLEVVSPKGLLGAFNVNRLALECVDNNEFVISTVIGEPQFSRHELRPSLGVGVGKLELKHEMVSHIMAYSDGKHDLLEIANILGVPMWDLIDYVKLLKEKGLLRSVNDSIFK